MLKINIVRLPHAAELNLPQQGTPLSAGLDLSAAISEPLELAPGQRALVPTGFSVALPPGYEGQIRSRSGLSFKNGLVVLNAPGTIDADYRGEIKVLLINFGEETFTIERGMRIAQLVITKLETISWCEVVAHNDIEKLYRNEAGFGSTGTHQQLRK